MKGLLGLCFVLTACTVSADEQPLPPDAKAPPTWQDAGPSGTAACLAQVVGPFSTGQNNSGPCWMQVTIDVRCQRGIAQRPRRIALYWSGNGPMYGGGYVDTTYMCDQLATAVFYNTSCTGTPIMGGGRFEDPLTPGIFNDASPMCDAEGLPRAVPRTAPSSLDFDQLALERK